MGFSRAILGGLVLAVSLLLVSCSGREDTVLAEFQDQTITVADYEKAYRVVKPRFLPKATGVEGHKEFLNTMLNKAVMAYKADELGYDKDPSVVAGMKQFKSMALKAGLVNFRVQDRMEITEEQLREHYRNKGSTVSVKQILCDTPDEAEEVYQLLMDGADFETVCREHSKSPDADKGGSVLEVKYGRYPTHMQREIFKQPIGGITEPILSQWGYFVMKIVDRTDSKKRQSFEEMRETLEQEVRVQNEMLLAMEVNDEIMEKANLTWFWENLRIAFMALPPDRPITSAPDRRDEVYPLLYFEEEDLDKPLATYKDKTLTIRDFSDYYDQSSFYERPRRENRLAGIKMFLGHYIIDELMAEEVVSSGIENRKEVKAAIDGKWEELMVSRLYEEMVNSQTLVTRKMVSDYYTEHQDRYKSPEKRRFGVILTGDLEKAQAAYEKIEAGERFNKVAMEYSIDEETRNNLAETDLLVKGRQPEMDDVGFSLADVGDVSKPFETSRGWMILKLKEKSKEKTMSLQQARVSIESTLKQRENEKRLNELLDKWKEELGLVIYEDRLSKIQVKTRTPTEKA